MERDSIWSQDFKVLLQVSMQKSLCLHYFMYKREQVPSSQRYLEDKRSKVLRDPSLKSAVEVLGVFTCVSGVGGAV